MARGRSKHKDILTPREWEVVALIRAGLSNQQIGERLGISERTAKFHVSQILGKLGLPRRRDVARWQIEQKPSWPAIFVSLVLFRRVSVSILSSKGLAIAAGGVVLAAAGSLALIGALVVRQTVATGDGFTVTMSGRSMEDTVPADAKLLAERYGERAVRRGDIVVFAPPGAAVSDSGQYFVKRVVGLPGDSVAVHDGAAWINGEPLDEPYIKELPGYTYDPTFVPADSYFVLGDNRNNSSDSHSWGPLPADKILGRVVRVSGPP